MKNDEVVRPQLANKTEVSLIGISASGCWKQSGASPRQEVAQNSHASYLVKTIKSFFSDVKKTDNSFRNS
jgi:hypothetical protein